MYISLLRKLGKKWKTIYMRQIEKLEITNKTASYIIRNKIETAESFRGIDIISYSSSSYIIIYYQYKSICFRITSFLCTTWSSPAGRCSSCFSGPVKFIVLRLFETAETCFKIASKRWKKGKHSTVDSCWYYYSKRGLHFTE